MRSLHLLLCLWVSDLSLTQAGTLTEQFTVDPLAAGWKIHGQPELFSWQENPGQLAVTWDSSRSNSFFYHSLGTIVTRDDDFAFEFKVRVLDIAIGTTPSKPYTFQIAAGFLNQQSATASNFNRGSGLNNATGPKNLVEFNYFPDSSFGATVAITAVSTNNRFAFGHHHPLELTVGDWFQVVMSYSATNRSLQTTMTKNGEAFGLPPDQQFPALSLSVLPDFRVDAFAISSYSDAGQNPPEFSGSILAHGIIDDISYTVPAPPVNDLRVWVGAPTRALQFTGRTGWVYQSERTLDLSNWVIVSPLAFGSNTLMTLYDTNTAGLATAFYRVRATRP